MSGDEGSMSLLLQDKTHSFCLNASRWYSVSAHHASLYETTTRRSPPARRGQRLLPGRSFVHPDASVETVYFAARIFSPAALRSTRSTRVRYPRCAITLTS